MRESLHINNFLFTPALRSDLYEKSTQYGADLVIFDLEDAVAQNDKKTAREYLISWLSKEKRERVGVRINDIKTEEGLLDVLALRTLPQLPPVIMVPKMDTKQELAIFAQWLDLKHQKSTVIPLIETAKGVANAMEISSHFSVGMLMFGGVDWSSDVGFQYTKKGAQFAASQVINAAAVHGLQCIETPFFDIKNPEALYQDTLESKAFGFGARSAIHPSQIQVINQVFLPTEQEIAHARRVVEIADNQGVGVLEGKMVDEAMARAARKTLARIKA